MSSKPLNPVSNHISLSILERIFDEAEDKSPLKPYQKMLYINCLNNHFRTIEVSLPGLNEFYYNFDEIPCFNQIREHFNQLEKSGLIYIFEEEKRILFVNYWTKYIDVGSLFEVSSMKSSKEIDHYSDQMYSSIQLYELCQMKYRLKQPDVNGLLQLFIAEQTATKKKYPSESDARRHFISWIRLNMDKVQKSKVRVVSSAQML